MVAVISVSETTIDAMSLVELVEQLDEAYAELKAASERVKSIQERIQIIDEEVRKSFQHATVETYVNAIRKALERNR